MPRTKQIPVYKKEKEAGLAEQIRSTASIHYSLPLINTPSVRDAETELLLHKFAKANNIDEEQFDLYYLKTILVTTGWNRNDDVFDRAEVWTARYSPIHKQFNLNHDQSRIIGHMTSAQAVNEEFEPLADDLDIEDLPAKFHILTDAVIYRELEDKESKDEIEKIIAEIAEGNWYVSMECLFRNFDYAIVSPTGEKRVVARNEESAFLTKHLRAYGGSGKYEDYTVGRLLKSIVFSGKGLVRDPANPESIIFQNSEKIQTFKQVAGYVNLTEPELTTEKPLMSQDIDATVQLQERLDQALNTIAELNNKIKDFETSQTTAQITSLTADRDGYKTQAEDLASKLSDAVAKATQLESDLIASRNEIAAMKSAEVVRARVQIPTDKNAPKEDAESFVKLMSDKSDEDFNSFAEKIAPMWQKPLADASASTSTATASVVVPESPFEEKPKTNDPVGQTDSEADTVAKIQKSLASILFSNNSEGEE